MGFKNIPSMNNIYQGNTASDTEDAASKTPIASYNVMCVLGFILSLAFILPVFCFFFFSFVKFPIFIVALFLLGVASLIVSIIGVSSIDKDKQIGFGFGIAGLIISLLNILASIIITILTVALGTLAFGTLLSLTADGQPKYTGPLRKCDNYEIKLENSENSHTATLVTWYWNGDPNNNVIDIPNTYEDITICAVGDTDSTPFEIKIDPSLQNYLTSDVAITEKSQAYKIGVPENTDIHFYDLEFTIKLGSKINMVDRGNLPHYGIWNEDGSITFYNITLKYECSADNPYFYSKNGELYKRGSEQPAAT